MTELTLESLAERVARLESALAANGASKDWRKVVGMFRDSEFMRKVDEECQRQRDVEREEARRGQASE
ncbi:MAG: hypothetical protein EXS05_23690 [Planctomycetaceae bacterium]|nr:hypothetical protein [Planctomycetaceae bacterium]